MLRTPRIFLAGHLSAQGSLVGCPDECLAHGARDLRHHILVGGSAPVARGEGDLQASLEARVGRSVIPGCS